MAELMDSRTYQNLKAAFAVEVQAICRYLYFARIADVEGYPAIAGSFRGTAEDETSHAYGHLDHLQACGDPVTQMPFGDTESNLRAALAGETYETTDMYPGMARAARAEGFDEIADWFEALATAGRSHAARFQELLDRIQ